MSNTALIAGLGLLVLLAACTQAASTPTPAPMPPERVAQSASPERTPPTPTETSATSVLDDSANFAASPQVTSGLIGTVVEKSRAESAPLEGGGSATYGYWTVRVERYLVDPRPYAAVELRFIEGFIQADGSRMPPRFPVSLKPGQRAVFFLTRNVGTAHQPMEGATFTAPLGPGGYTGILTITDGQVDVWRDGKGVPEPLEEFVSRTMEVARKHGREVGN